MDAVVHVFGSSRSWSMSSTPPSSSVSVSHLFFVPPMSPHSLASSCPRRIARRSHHPNRHHPHIIYMRIVANLPDPATQYARSPPPSPPKEPPPLQLLAKPRFALADMPGDVRDGPAAVVNLHMRRNHEAAAVSPSRILCHRRAAIHSPMDGRPLFTLSMLMCTVLLPRFTRARPPPPAAARPAASLSSRDPRGPSAPERRRCGSRRAAPPSSPPTGNSRPPRRGTRPPRR